LTFGDRALMSDESLAYGFEVSHEIGQRPQKDEDLCRSEYVHVGLSALGHAKRRGH
jgi:hypothetical protein